MALSVLQFRLSDLDFQIVLLPIFVHLRLRIIRLIYYRQQQNPIGIHDFIIENEKREEEVKEHRRLRVRLRRQISPPL